MENTTYCTEEECKFHDYHDPLNPARKELRLLTISPGEYDDTLICELAHASLLSDPPPVYETISYCWGVGSDRGRMNIQGQSICVPYSSINALCRVRLVDRPRLVWIDAVCINQQDVHERNSQVRLMSEIYGHASGNLIYLGEQYGSVEQAITLIELLYNDCKDSAAQHNPFIARDRTLGRAEGLTGKFGELDLEPLRKLCARAWFSRLWTLQEAALAVKNTCICGTLTFDLLTLLRAIAWLFVNSEMIAFVQRTNLVEGVARLVEMWLLLDIDFVPPELSVNNRQSAATSMLWLLSMAHKRRTTEPRDTVYAVLALCTHYRSAYGLSTSLLPDYSKPLEDVLYEASAYAIETANGLGNILSAVQHRSDSKVSTWPPSWVPRWDRIFERGEDAWLDTMECASADFGQAPCSPPSIKSNILQVHGFVVDAVHVASDVARPARVSTAGALAPFLESLRAMVQQHFPDVDQYKLARTLGAAPYQEGQTADLPLQKGYEGFMRLVMNMNDEGGLNIDLTPEEIQDTIQWRDALTNYVYRILHTCTNRRFFIGNQQTIGVGPRAMQPGDVVAIVYGCVWPCILRPVAEELFQFVGIAHVSDIMVGEAVKRRLNGGGPDRLFQIC